MSEDKFKDIFQKNLNQYMAARHVTPTIICERLGVSKASVSQWRAGAKIPRMDKIEKLARLLGVTKSDLLEEKPPETGGKYSFLDDLTQEELQNVKAFVAGVKSQRNQ